MGISATARFRLMRITKETRFDKGVTQKALFCGLHVDDRPSNVQSVEMAIEDLSMLESLIPLVGEDFEATFTLIEKTDEAGESADG